ncbi:COP9 signalosome complex subunit 7b-like [Colossoma macropomum]|uniref:COP9 signalosome complex subunit 7b-like n=1 Tax=Colossoma macropomum TaxID=42526 RepID=UPI001864EFC7|nr:COP9 signalosome complex subunit 7b-like [Colossoma macropomum]
MATEQKCGHGSPLQQFVLLAKNLRGAALVSLINRMLETPGVYTFGEFLDLPHVKELSKGPNDGYTRLLEVFAYGVYHDYQANEGTLPPLSEAQKNKLRHLTIATLAANMQCIPYSVLQTALEVASVRQLEDVLIEAVYSDVIRGKLDQCKQQLEVDACIGRDMRSMDTGELAQTLKNWCASCESICCAIESQVHKVRQSRDCLLLIQQQVHAEVCNIHKMLTAVASSSSSSSSSLSSAVPQPPEQERLTGGTEQRVSCKNTSKSKNISSPKH